MGRRRGAANRRPAWEAVGIPRNQFSFGRFGPLTDSLLFESHWRPADALCLEVDTHLDAVSDRDEGNAAIYPVVLAVKGHGALDLAGPGPIPRNYQRQLLRFCDSAYREVAIHFKGNGLALHCWAGLSNPCRMERDVRIVLDVEEVFALQLAILHAASGIDAGRINLNIQNTSIDIRGRKLKSGIPLVEFSNYRNRGLHIEVNLA